MNKNLLNLLVILLFPLVARSQDEVVKTGWNFGALPSISFDSDLGFQYGALVDFYNYGGGERYPAYEHRLYLEVSRYTKGSGINRFYFDSDRLIRGLQTAVDLSYLSDQAYDFYGFNGYEAVVHPEWIDDEDAEYVSRMFYKYDRKLFRFKVDVQGPSFGENLKWLGGMNLLHFNVGSVDIDRLNKGKSGDDLLPETEGLYEIYQQWGIISQEEADGGFIPEFKAG